MTVEDVAVIWHEAECGGYVGDLALWEELAAEVAGPILELGCGTGRVSLHLARRGHHVVGIDLSEGFVAAMRSRAAELPVEASVADAREFELGRRFELVLAPMQLIQLFDSPAERLRCLRSVERHLRPNGLAGFALVERATPTTAEMVPPPPDTHEADDLLYSSLPIENVVDDETIVIRRLRQVLAPAGRLSEELDEVRLRPLSAEALEEEGMQAGLRPAGRQQIPPTAEHVGSTVVLLGRAR